MGPSYIMAININILLCCVEYIHTVWPLLICVSGLYQIVAGVYPCSWGDLASWTLFMLCEFPFAKCLAAIYQFILFYVEELSEKSHWGHRIPWAQGQVKKYISYHLSAKPSSCQYHQFLQSSIQWKLNQAIQVPVMVWYIQSVYPKCYQSKTSN